MAARSRDALPVLEEWYDGPVSGERPCNRPRACGVVGCAEPLVKAGHQKYHLCAAHIKCPTVLRRGVLQRWCGTCHKFHALQAFSGSRRYAPASRWERCAHPQTAYPLQTFSRVLHIARCSFRLNRALCCVQGAQFACALTQGSCPMRIEPRGRSCMASLKARSERVKRKRQAPMRSPAEAPRNISSAALSRSGSRVADDDVADTSGSASGSSYASSTADGAPEPGGAAGNGPRAGGASQVASERCCWLSGHGGRELWAVASAA